MGKNLSIIDLCVKFEKVELKQWRLLNLLENFGENIAHFTYMNYCCLFPLKLDTDLALHNI